MPAFVNQRNVIIIIIIIIITAKSLQLKAVTACTGKDDWHAQLDHVIPWKALSQLITRRSVKAFIKLSRYDVCTVFTRHYNSAQS